MTRQLPDHLSVRYDYHEHPTGVSAVLTTDEGHIAAVGFAKFNHRDPAFSFDLGERIALGRALGRYEDGRGILVHPAFVPSKTRLAATLDIR